MSTTTIDVIEDLGLARKGSWYTILGCGGDLQDWVNGYEEIMAREGIGKPRKWYRSTGGAINRYAGWTVAPEDMFPDDLTVLLFPLGDLDISKLVPFRLRMKDKWFDDIIDNMRRR